MKKILISIITFFLLISCAKQEDITINKLEEEIGNFLPLSIGNYWIYEVSQVDTNGNSTFQSIDSTYIEGDTTINNNMYFIFKSSTSINYVQFIRDSSGFIVDNNGQKFLYQMLIDDTLYTNLIKSFNGDTLTFTYRMMSKPPSKIYCGLGYFTALDAEVTRYLAYTNTTAYAHYYYSSNIGLILRQDYFTFAGKRTEYSLIRYMINNP